MVVEARRRTLVLAYFPRSASEEDVLKAVGSVGSACKGRIARDANGSSRCFGFFEFVDEASCQEVLAACKEGRIVLDDEFGHTWHLRASRARRATAEDHPGFASTGQVAEIAESGNGREHELDQEQQQEEPEEGIDMVVAPSGQQQQNAGIARRRRGTRGGRAQKARMGLASSEGPEEECSSSP